MLSCVSTSSLSSSKFDTENDAFTTGINNCLTKDGQNAATGDLPMGGNIHTGVGDGTARTHYASVGQVQDGAVLWGGTSGGAANVQTITLSPAITAYSAGQRFALLPGFTNTGSTTLNVNSVGAKTLKQNGQNILGGALRTDVPVLVMYDGTDFEVVSDQKRMFCDVYDLTTAQTINTGVTAEVQFASETSDLWTLHDTVTNNQRITVPGGMWSITGCVSLVAAPDAASTLTIHIGGSTTYFLSQFDGKHVNVSGIVYSSGSNYFTLSLQNGGSATATVSTARFSATRVG